MSGKYPFVKLLFADGPVGNIERPSEKYAKPDRNSGPAPERRVPKGIVDPSTITKIKALRDPERKAIFKKVFAGEPLPEVERDNMLQRIVSTFAWADEGKSTDEALIALIAPSIEHWEEDDRTGDWVDTALEKMSRASADFHETHGKRIAEIETLRKVLVPGAKPDFKHLALQQDTTFYVYAFDEQRYWPAHTSRELPVVLRDAWPAGSPVELTYENAKGETKKKTMAMVLDEYGTAIREVVYSMSNTHTVYDPGARLLRVPTATRKEIEPKYHEQIDTWLRKMPANPDHAEMLLDWIATVTNLDRMSAALYLSGPKSTGKSLLVAGLSCLWTRGPTKLEHVFCRFNDSMMNCPLINVDEYWRDQNTNLCAALRELVGNMTHQIERKGKAIVTLEGAVRLIITANNETLLSTRGNGDQNQLEREATIERILHVPTDDKAAKFLASVKDRHLWREENRIAEHALWLRDERAQAVIDRALEEGHRFLIQGDSSDADFYDGIGSKPKDHDAAVRWLSCVLTRKPIPAIRDMVRIEEGKFVVVPRALVESWKAYGLSELFDVPVSSRKATSILNPFIKKGVSRPKLKGVNGYYIDIERFARAAMVEASVPIDVLKKKLGVEVGAL